MALCFFGAYDPAYSRTAILRRGLALNGQPALELHLPARLKAWARYPLGFGRALTFKNLWRQGSVHLFVPSFGHKDVPLAFILTRLFGRRLIFDPLASRYETKILDWQRQPQRSLAAFWNHFLDRWSLRLSDLVLADTSAHKEYYCQEFGLAKSRVAVLPVGFDDSIWRPATLSVPKNKPFTVVFFGSFLPLHGVEQVARAAGLLSQEKPPIYFRFIGSGQTWPRVQTLLQESKAERISLEGWLAERDLALKVAAEADLCLGLFGRSPKAWRVVPHKIFQALALGKPVLTLDTPAVREFFRPQEEIYLCPSSEPEAIAQAIIELRQDEALRRRLAEQGRDLVWQKYTPLVLGRTLLELVKSYFNSGVNL